MKSFVRFQLAVLLTLAAATSSAYAAQPEVRPALLGNHPRSLINLINTESLMKRGQGDAIVLFSCGVSKLGYGYGMQVYRGTPNSDLLKKELMGRSDQAQFIPAIFRGHPVAVYIDGTVSFSIVNGKPRLRIFLNQEESELGRGADFIAPQLAFVPGNTKYKGMYYPPSAPGVAGVAGVLIDVDAAGNVKSTKATYEHPAGVGFGAAAAGPLIHAQFIPAFRNGKPVACRFTFPMIWQGRAAT
jgi:hypothetical protein